MRSFCYLRIPGCYRHAPFPVKNPYSRLYLHNILISPAIIKNLIFVRQLTQQNKTSIEFDSFSFTIKEYKTRRPLIRCDSDGSLYPVTPTNPQVLISTDQSIWHQRLGHPGDQVLKSLVLNNSISCTNDKLGVLCNSCQIGKHTKLPFFASNSVVSHPFEIIHSDIWTSPIPRVSGLRYYVIFLDHFTHYLWVFLLKQKSEVFTKFQEFSTMSKPNSTLISNFYNAIIRGNTTTNNFMTSSPQTEFNFVSRALIRPNKMGNQNACFELLTTWFAPCFFTLIFLPHFG